MESLGARFKQERERKGMTLDDVALSTKIGVRMLQSLEEDRYDRLPGGIFNKGFVRAYARHLGLNEEQALADYMAATGPPPVEVQPVAVMEALAAHAVESRGQKLNFVDRIPWGTVAILLMVVAIGLTIWGPRSQPLKAPKQDHPPSSSQPGRDPIATSAASAANESMSPGQALTRGAFSLRIQANEDSWLSITADGNHLLQGVLPARSQKSIAANREIVVKAGNVGALEFWFNNQKLAAQGDFDEVKALTFTAGGLQPAAAGMQSPATRTTP